MKPEHNILAPELQKALTGSHLQTFAKKFGERLDFGWDALPSWEREVGQ